MKEKALKWWESLTDNQKDRIQYTLTTPLNYTKWGDGLIIEAFKKNEK